MKRLSRFLSCLRDDRVRKLPPFSTYQKTEAATYLRQLMIDNYTVARLENVTPDQFESYITSLPGHRDGAAEGYTDLTRQRDLSVQFEWGHNHDFDTFYMQGLMENRHVDILATFMNIYGVPKHDLSDKSVLDIGCWTGGTSLLLAAMGAEVFAIEEVKKYADCVEYLKNAFGLDSLYIENRSLYSLNDARFFDKFDLVLYSGVLYHVTDPLLSLRIVFNSLRDGGSCLLETMAVDGKGSYCEYQGAHQTLDRPIEDGKPRSGWNWFVPSLEAIRSIMRDVGFRVEGVTLHKGNRALALGIREKHVGILRAGLSRRNIR